MTDGTAVNGRAGWPGTPSEAVAHQGRSAGLVSRAIAAGIDVLVVGLVLLAGYGAICGVTFLLKPRSFTFPTWSVLVNLTTAFVLLTAYLSVCWAVSGRTYGCAVMGLRVVDRRGANPRLLVAVARAVFYALVPIGLLLCAVSARNRSLQDLVTRTSVIYDWQNLHPPRTPGAPTERGDHDPASA
jgi:uncharacterized RDD family membrane protein YckC